MKRLVLLLAIVVALVGTAFAGNKGGGYYSPPNQYPTFGTPGFSQTHGYSSSTDNIWSSQSVGGRQNFPPLRTGGRHRPHPGVKARTHTISSFKPRFSYGKVMSLNVFPSNTIQEALGTTSVKRVLCMFLLPCVLHML